MGISDLALEFFDQIKYNLFSGFFGEPENLA